jgi:uncharacterized membrane protein YgdD (TMEM256/DUF423 family)
LGASAVTLGAYHAHGLEKWLAGRGLATDKVQEQMHNCDVAVRYQMVHALALLGIGLLARGGISRLVHVSGTLFLLGVVGFSGGLYLMVFAGTSIHWAIVPGGGLLLIVAWFVLALAALLPSKNSARPDSTPG